MVRTWHSLKWNWWKKGTTHRIHLADPSIGISRPNGVWFSLSHHESFESDRIKTAACNDRCNSSWHSSPLVYVVQSGSGARTMTRLKAFGCETSAQAVSYHEPWTEATDFHTAQCLDCIKTMVLGYEFHRGLYQNATVQNAIYSITGGSTGEAVWLETVLQLVPMKDSFQSTQCLTYRGRYLHRECHMSSAMQWDSCMGLDLG